MPSPKNKTCDIVLISPMMRGRWIYLPFSLLYLSSYLEENGISTRIVDLKMKKIESLMNFKNRYIDTILKGINEIKPLLIGLTCYTSEYNSIMELAQLIKMNVDIPIVVGGVHATLKPEDFIFYRSPIDFAVIGEGENPLLTLVDVLKRKYSYEKLQSTAYLDNGEMQIRGICNVEEDINQFPMPDYDKIDMGFYTEPYTGHIRLLLLSGVQIVTSRGCPYNCDFCANNYLRLKNEACARIRFRSIDQIIEEIEFLGRRYKIDGFYIIDDCFMVSKKRTADFCEKLIGRRLDLVWGMETRVNFIDDESLLKLMKRAGLIQIDFGVESGSPVMLKAIHKGISVEQTKRAFELCRKNRIRTFANIMFNLPGETKEDILLTEKLLNEIKPTVLGMALTVPLLGTRIYERYVFPKLTPAEYELYNKNVYYEIVDNRFKLAKDDTDFARLMGKLRLKFGKLQGISFNPAYLRKVINSRFFHIYVIKFLNERINQLVDLFINTYVIHVPTKIKNFTTPILRMLKRLVINRILRIAS